MQIKEMIMRIPGIGKQEAEQIAREVGRALGQHAWRWPQGGAIGDLQLKLDFGAERSRDALVSSIVNAMVKAIDSKTGY